MMRCVSGGRLASYRRPVITCVCCGRWTVEQVTVDRLDGRGPRTVLRVRHLGSVRLETDDPARVLDLLAERRVVLP